MEDVYKRQIKDIAKKLGIATSTVSKGLNGAKDISEETRQLVLDTAVEMGYAVKRDVYKRQASICPSSSTLAPKI